MHSKNLVGILSTSPYAKQPLKEVAVDEPIFDNPDGAERLLPIRCFTLDEVLEAQSSGRPLVVYIARVVLGREEAHPMRMESVAKVSVCADGFSFVAYVRQIVMRLLNDYAIESTYTLEGRRSLCRVTVGSGGVSIEFCTSVTVSEVTGVFSWE